MMISLLNNGFRGLCGLLLCITVSSSAFAIEPIPEQQKIIDQVSVLLLAENFKKLNELAHEYRIKKSRTADGSWKLNAFYLGVSQLADVQNQNQLFWNALEDKTRKWTERFPNSPPAHIARAIVLSRHGWMFRNMDNNSSHISENWLAFFQYNQAALQQLQRHKAIASVDPTWYEEMAWVTLSLGGDKGKILGLLNQGLQQEPSFQHLALDAFFEQLDDPHFNSFNATASMYSTNNLIKKMDQFTIYLWIVLQSYLR